MPILYANMQEAVKALCEYTRIRKYNEFEMSEADAEAGISVRVYQNYEQGVRDIEKVQLSVPLKICIVLDCKMSDIFMNEEMVELVKKYHK